MVRAPPFPHLASESVSGAGHADTLVALCASDRGRRSPTSPTRHTSTSPSHPADGAARELIKYLTKDILPGGKLVSPRVFAELYIALDGKRISQPSAGFFKGIDRKAECSCGAIGCFRRTTREPETGEDGKLTDDAFRRLTKGRREQTDE